MATSFLSSIFPFCVNKCGTNICCLPVLQLLYGRVKHGLCLLLNKLLGGDLSSLIVIDIFQIEYIFTLFQIERFYLILLMYALYFADVCTIFLSVVCQCEAVRIVVIRID